jgi:hypothetical protein
LDSQTPSKMDNQEEHIKRLQNMGYELVKSTSSSLLFQVRAEKGFTGEAMEIIHQIGDVRYFMPLEGKPGYYEFCVLKVKKENRYK